jgi:hypothetical protein
MKLNIGTMDRILRTIVGILIIIYGFVNHSWLGVIGILPLVTAFIAFCPGYFSFGYSTRGKHIADNDCCNREKSNN